MPRHDNDGSRNMNTPAVPPSGTAAPPAPLQVQGLAPSTSAIRGGADKLAGCCELRLVAKSRSPQSPRAKESKVTRRRLEHPLEIAETLLPGWKRGVELVGAFQVPARLVGLGQEPVGECAAIEYLRLLRKQPQGLVTVPQRLVGPAQESISPAMIVVGPGMIWIEGDGLVVVLDGLVVVTLPFVSESPVAIGEGITRIEANGRATTAAAPASAHPDPRQSD